MSTLIIAATEPELAWLISRLRARPDRPLLGFPVYRASDAFLVLSGPGMANAAGATAAAAERFQPRRIYNIGICGSYAADQQLLGRPVIGTQAVFADTGAAGGAAFHTLETMGLELCRSAGRSLYNSIPLDIAAGAPDLPSAQFLTVSSVSACRAAADQLCCRFQLPAGQLLCEDMESAAVALIALRAGIPCSVVRGISNICGERDRANWKLFEAAQAAQEIIYSLLQP